MIDVRLLPDQGIAQVTLESPLDEGDFQQIAAVVDPYIHSHGRLHGILIDAEHFAGWENFAGMMSHLRFVRDHHQLVDRVAIVTDSHILAMLPAIASHFVSAEVRYFAVGDRTQALTWLESTS